MRGVSPSRVSPMGRLQVQLQTSSLLALPLTRSQGSPCEAVLKAEENAERRLERESLRGSLHSRAVLRTVLEMLLKCLQVLKSCSYREGQSPESPLWMSNIGPLLEAVL